MNTPSSTDAVLAGLEAAGLLEPARRAEAETVVRAALEDSSRGIDAGGSMRRRLSEIAGYVGGAFVVGASGLFVATGWNELSRAGQVSVFLGGATVLVLVALALTAAAGGRARLATEAESVRRRLTSVLFTGAAGCTAFGVGLLLETRLDNVELGVLISALVGLVTALVGYRIAPTAVGQLGMMVAAFVSVPSGLGALDTGSTSTIPLGLALLLLGAGWLVLAELGVWHEVLAARVIGTVVAVIGAQTPLFDNGAWVAYVATALVGGLAFWLYVVSRAWPYLATGVVAITLAVPEALSDWFDGALGAAGVLLATGVTLLLTALAGLRLRQEVIEG